MVSFANWPFVLSDRAPPVPIGHRLGRPQTRSGLCEEVYLPSFFFFLVTFSIFCFILIHVTVPALITSIILIIMKWKRRVVPFHTMNTGGTDPVIPNLDTRKMHGQLHVPAALASFSMRVSGTRKRTSPLSVFQTQTVQSVARLYIHYAIPAPIPFVEECNT